MNQMNLKYCFRVIFVGFFFISSLSALGQADSKWWKRNIAELSDSTAVDSLIFSDTIKKYPFLVSPEKGSLTIFSDSAIIAIDSMWRAEEKVLNGFRIQIHFGSLESARAVRAKCRKEMELDRIYLTSIAPNYSVEIGDFRNRWEAELTLNELKEHFKGAVIRESEINLPKLP